MKVLSHWPVSLALLTTLSTAGANQLLITEYLEGSSNNKALELTNRSDQPLDLSRYRVDVYFNGSTSAGASLNLNGSLAPNASYVVAHASANDAILSVADQTYGGGLFNGDDFIALTRDDQIIDSIGQLGVDPGSQWGDGVASTQNATLRRNVEILDGDTDVNDVYDVNAQWQGFASDDSSDLGQYLTTPPETGELGQCGESYTLISAIQGTGEESPLTGEAVNIEAIVSYDGTEADALRGLFVQSATADIDLSADTSEGLFIYTGSESVEVSVGQRIRLRGNVGEYYGQTQLSQIADWTLCAGQEEQPSYQVITLNEQNLPQLEPYEGMLVSFVEPLTVTSVDNLFRYGELLLSSHGRQMIPTDVVRPGLEAEALAERNRSNRLVLDDGSTRSNPQPIPYPAPELSADYSVRVGDQVNQLSGVLGYGFNQFRIHPTQRVQLEFSNPRVADPQQLNPDFYDPEQLTIGSFNVLNYFNGDGLGNGFPTSRGADNATELQRQQDKLVAALGNLNADIVGLMEIENDGYADTSAVAQLTAALNNELGGDVYAFIAVVADKLGGDQITQALLYKPARVELIGQVATTAEEPFDYGNRQPLAASFKPVNSNDALTVVVNHFKSKGGCPRDGSLNEDQNDGQACWNELRTQAASALVDWLASNPTQASTRGTVLLGDFNAYSQEDPLQVFLNGGFVNSANYMTNSHHSYLYQAESGALDHLFLSADIANLVSAANVWHINADEVPQLDYNVEGKSELQLDQLYRPDSYRASDHDPLIVQLDWPVIPTNEAPVAGFKAYHFWLFTYFKNTSSDADGHIVENQWTFSDGYQSRRKHVLRLFWWPNQTQVSLTVTDNEESSTTITKSFE
ncbi:ExeM/NucH family extracellular endonuclease [Pleionea litopenaei]|uniref:ExeM/NucH family extracellular endonuclease n=1 Tax=Pleionea litopenaei TaxID=3070815 RepID=A0AA51RSD0_9GAMM|nr:ExeM/NucH family extracellular endonuclease [Pleionea sp. HL-JVS1]WMS86716.1 ExeM/NucH family extracellular endonuclease [Pleionea sp. HL-JVS1]